MQHETDAMTIDVEAIYENGVLKLKEPVDLPENAEVHVTIQPTVEARTPLGRRLRELRAEIAKSGAAPLSWGEIESEVASRRGGDAKDREAHVCRCRCFDQRGSSASKGSGSSAPTA